MICGFESPISESAQHKKGQKRGECLKTDDLKLFGAAELSNNLLGEVGRREFRLTGGTLSERFEQLAENEDLWILTGNDDEILADT